MGVEIQSQGMEEIMVGSEDRTKTFPQQVPKQNGPRFVDHNLDGQTQHYDTTSDSDAMKVTCKIQTELNSVNVKST